MIKTMLTAMLFMALLLVASTAFAKDDNLMSFEITPNPMDKECSISVAFHTLGAIGVNLHIETLSGEVVKNIYTGQVNKSMIFNWDRQSNAGEYVPAGTYLVALSYENRYTSTKKTVILK